MYDLILQNGQVFDGTGNDPVHADIAIKDGLIVDIGPNIDGDAGEVVDAAGKIVTPGFVDVHGHYDGQATWDDLLEPSSGHGVTTVVVGNCGVGFAPVRPTEHEALISLMEGVEDIPGAALSEGISWGWESFPDYLNVLDKREWAIDVATQLPHGSLRSYVRGNQPVNDPATPDEVDAMARLAREAVEAGAFGFTTSRTLGHKALDGTPVPGTYATAQELMAIGRSIAAGGGRVFEIAPSGLARSDDPEMVARELDWIGELANETGLNATFILLQLHNEPERWRKQMAQAASLRSKGSSVTPLIAGRPFATIWGWDVRHPFQARPTYKSLANLPLLSRLEELRKPSIRASILSESDEPADIGEKHQLRYINLVLKECFLLTGQADYEQPLDRRIGDIAKSQNSDLATVAYDMLISEDDAMLFYPLYNYESGDHRVLLEQLEDKDAVVGLNDGGAHCAFICDASIPTYMMTHWARDRARGPRIELAEVVRRLSSQPAELYGLSDRGRLAKGLRADINVINYEQLTLGTPRAAADLPAGGTRLLQDATGYEATIVAGSITRKQGADTGARPGRLVRRA